jgi:hypothetical protein
MSRNQEIKLLKILKMKDLKSIIIILDIIIIILEKQMVKIFSLIYFAYHKVK